ncbi:uncharacterized protein zgc:171459 [Trichomycterus rosablanca]|uniref:uncharacterized protein zgc:171459 n=1 Tax=Trichomycterus rosablanca TaxID=2290929 RepID=UPI002F351E81
MASSEFTYKLTDEDIKKLIRLRTTNAILFTRKRNAAKAAWSAILRELRLDDKVTVEQIAKKWENLKLKYKEIKYPPPGMEATPRASQWRWYKLLDEALKDEFIDTGYNQMTSSEGDDESGPRTSKRLCQVKVGGDVLELLVDDDGTSRIADSGASLLGEDNPSGLSNLEVERSRLAQERHIMEKELEELDSERLVLEREKDLADREKLALQRDRAQLEKDRAAVDRDRASLEQDRARLEKDRAGLERDKAALIRDREALKAVTHGKNITESSLDTQHDKNREKLAFLFERLIEKF